MDSSAEGQTKRPLAGLLSAAFDIEIEIKRKAAELDGSAALRLIDLPPLVAAFAAPAGLSLQFAPNQAAQCNQSAAQQVKAGRLGRDSGRTVIGDADFGQTVIGGILTA